MKNYDEARKICEAAISTNPQDEIAYSNLAHVFIQLNNPDGAIQNARKAIEIFPQFADAYLNLGRAYAVKGLASQAREAFARATKWNPAFTAGGRSGTPPPKIKSRLDFL
jgi:tetratricopeptide (TPR) repeat protein